MERTDKNRQDSKSAQATCSIMLCPFCGSTGQSYTRENVNGITISIRPVVRCRRCGAEVHGNTRVSAIEKWNTRGPLELTGEDIAYLFMLVEKAVTSVPHDDVEDREFLKRLSGKVRFMLRR